jgi:hypothetical protein
MAAPTRRDIQAWAAQYGIDLDVVYAYAALHQDLPPPDPLQLGAFIQSLGDLARRFRVTRQVVSGYATATGALPSADADLANFLRAYGGADAQGRFNGREPPVGWNYLNDGGGDGVNPITGATAPPAPATNPGPIQAVTNWVGQHKLLAGGLALGAFVVLGHGRGRLL